MLNELNSVESLEGFSVQSLRNQELKSLDHSSEKWTKYFLDSREIGLLREMRGRADIPALGRFLNIDVGIVTGDNDYFLLDESTVNDFHLDAHSVPVVGRSAALPGIQFTQRDLEHWASEGKAARLFVPKRPFSAGVRKYVTSGEQRGVQSGYKCRIRKEWFVVPAVWTPDVFFLRQADSAPRIIANTTDATCTDTLHRGRVLDGAAADTLAMAFVNSLTWAVSEVSGRSYGGGVMTYEPSEVERLPLPVSGSESLDLSTLDALIRERNLEVALDIVDRVLLVEGCGISRRDVFALRRIWEKLRDRRRGRKGRSKTTAPYQGQADTTSGGEAARTGLTKLIA